ncbi:hypothetical protein D3C78_1889480 [compost metagenome]
MDRAQATNAPIDTTPTAATTSSSTRVQDGDSDCTVASASAPTATISKTIPTPSTRRRDSGLTDSFSSPAPNQSDTAPRGRLM